MSVKKILLFIISVMILLSLVGFLFPKEGVNIGLLKLRFSSLPEMIFIKEQTLKAPDPEIQMAAMARAFLQEKLDALTDSLDFYKHFFQESPVRIHFPADDPSMLDVFFATIDSCASRQQVVRVLHYGDSQIEQDRLSATLRDGLQKIAGGMGVGMIPAVQTIPSKTLWQSHEGNISRYLLYGPSDLRAPHNRYGPMAAVSEVDKYAYLMVNAYKRPDSDISNQFTQIRLLVGNNTPQFKATLELKDKYDTKTIREADEDLNIITWKLNAPIDNFSLFLNGSAEVYGILLDGFSGVAVDNIPLRGSSGTFFTSIDSKLLHKVYQEMDVQLFILEFGGNRMPSINSQDDVDAYARTIGRQIRYLKSLVPSAQVLFIGPADMSCSVEGRMQTYPLLEELILGLKEVVLENGAAFWDLYQVMGGRNSMINWVNAQPALASPDHIHFTPKGADRIADLLNQNFALCYTYYQFRNKHNLNDSVQLNTIRIDYDDYAGEFEQLIRDKFLFEDSLLEDLESETVLNEFLELLHSNIEQQ